MASRDYFLGKRIAVIGIGPHGEMLTDIKFLIKMNALVSVYDLRAEARISDHVASLKELGLADCLCGSVPPEDLLDMDLIILSHEYPRNSSFLAEARKQGIEIEYPETLFLKLAPPVTIVAVMGACGKATVVSMLAPMIEAASKEAEGPACYTIDPESDQGVLAHLRKIKNGDVAVMRIVEKMMGEIHALSWSPHVAIFTTVPPKNAFRESPFEILSYQTYNNYIIGTDQIIDAIRSSGVQSKAKMLRTKSSLVPDGWHAKDRNPYDRENAALALQAARIFKVSDDMAIAALSKWKPLKGRLEPVKKVKNIEFINDTASVSPQATVAGMTMLSNNRNLVVIVGGADSGGDYREMYAAVGHYAHTLVVLPGSGTLKEREALRRLDKIEVVSVPTIEEAVRSALDHANKGDRVLFSPAFDAGGMDGSRLERGERFVRAVRSL
ncbi:MAG: cyanophycin synthetase [Candidatus Paceibacterota bacterium]